MKKVLTVSDTSAPYKIRYRSKIGDFSKEIIEYGGKGIQNTKIESIGNPNVTIPKDETKFNVIRQEIINTEVSTKNIPTIKLVKTAQTLASSRLRLMKLRQKGDTIMFRFVPIVDRRREIVKRAIATQKNVSNYIKNQFRLDSLIADKNGKYSSKLAVIPEGELNSLAKEVNITSPVYDKAYNVDTLINAVNTAEQPVDFFIIKTDETNPVKVKYKMITLGTLVVPFKVRPGNNNEYYFTSNNVAKPDKVSSTVETKFNIGFYIGFRYGKIRYPKSIGSHSSWTTGIFVSPQSIAMSAKNSIYDRIINDPNPSREYNALGTTIGLTEVFTHKQVSVAFLTGVDFAHGDAAQYWVYQGKPWIGFGLGYKLGIFDQK
ncbi:hypothetical protein [Spirosoma sp. KNUC1025]|uniref:hypothetical protein n=1 Tax=Spirosoma sp. KNUC1025 TaxID=2894082 RepID=UPI0038647849|nr:hypothetical protein LN737_15185 [Spirosoma sp. KNUC1025]